MIRLCWRQFRTQAVVALGLLVVMAVLLAATGPHLAHLYQIYQRAQAGCAGAGNCRQVSLQISQTDRLLELLGTALVGVPALIGAFWGAPLITRELETGTHRLAWTQSISRTRWLAVKLAVGGTASIAATGLMSLMVTWWSSPIDRSRADRFSAGMFAERNVAPLGYAAFGFALGVAVGMLLRRTLPAMASTLTIFLGVRIAFTYQLRSHLLGPRHLALPLDPASIGFGNTNGGPDTLMPNPPNLPGAWIYSTRIVDSSGHRLTSQVVASSCPNLGNTLGGPPPGSGRGLRTQAPPGVQSALQACVSKVAASYHEVVIYQPANRYWLFQWYETAIYLIAALLLAGFSLWWLRRRAS